MPTSFATSLSCMVPIILLSCWSSVIVRVMVIIIFLYLRFVPQRGVTIYSCCLSNRLCKTDDEDYASMARPSARHNTLLSFGGGDSHWEDVGMLSGGFCEYCYWGCKSSGGRGGYDGHYKQSRVGEEGQQATRRWRARVLTLGTTEGNTRN